ncbi:MAG: hypothetical protein J6S75_04010 [Thermoguttaceae bacterium]|nr:hypothetical protein [Thermoguttaceae bacterium]
MIRQLSIFAENKRGAMHRITQTLADARINMNTLVTNDSAEFGIIRMLVSDTDKASACLNKAGYLCHIDYVAAAEIGDECGSLNSLLAILDRGNINLDYLYVTYSNLTRRPVAILRSVDIMEVEEFLTAKGYLMLENLE